VVGKTENQMANNIFLDNGQNTGIVKMSLAGRLINGRHVRWYPRYNL